MMGSNDNYALKLIETHGMLSAQDRFGTSVFELKFKGDKFTAGTFLLPDRSRLSLERLGEESAVLGMVDQFRVAPNAEPIARVTAIDWLSPDFIPAVDVPAALPSGAGSAVLNAVALIGEQRGIETLRYRGPYATASLFTVLGHSFTFTGDLKTGLEVFTSGNEDDALAAKSRERPIDFRPNPFGWHFSGEQVCAELHADGLRRIFVGGRAYGHSERSPRRLISEPTGGFRLVLVFNGMNWAERGHCSSDGMVDGELMSLPKVESVLMGQAIAPSVREALAAGLVPRAPLLMQPALEAVLLRAPMIWGDAGDDYCRVEEGGMVLHAMLGEALRGQAPLTVMNTLAGVIEYPSQQLAQAVVAEHHRRSQL